MFNALARLAEADGEDAMTVMAEKLMNAVKELSDVVENLEGVMSENGSQNKSLFEKLGSKFKDVVEGSAEKVKEIASAPQTVNVDMGPVILALNEIEDRLNMPLSVVVDDSI
jgi:regulator of replication initiation timing